MTKEAAPHEEVSIIGDPLDDDDREALKNLIAFLQPIVMQSAEQTTAMGRWLLASLLAVNGGAILACLNSTEVGGPWERAAILIWVAGLILALGSGLHAMFLSQRGIKYASNMIARVVTTLHAGVFQDLSGATKEGEELERRARRGIWIGAASAVSFLAGVAAVAIQPQATTAAEGRPSAQQVRSVHATPAGPAPARAAPVPQ